MADNLTKYTARDVKFFNRWRKYFQYGVTRFFYTPIFKILYRYEVYGKENIPKDNKYIAASNHLSTLDPPVVGVVLNKPVAYMSKKELFNNLLLRWWMDWLGAFAVDREKLGVSTIKTALNIKKTSDWVLGIFPQGTREKSGKITTVAKGTFALAKASKCGILPIGIVGTDEKTFVPFKGKVVVKIGKMIPYSDNIDEMADKWVEAIQELTGFEYLPEKNG